MVEVQEYYADVVAMEKNAFAESRGDERRRRIGDFERPVAAVDRRRGYLERVVGAETTSVRASSAISESRDVSPVMWRDWCTNKRLDCLIFVGKDEARRVLILGRLTLPSRVALAVDLSKPWCTRYSASRANKWFAMRSLSKDLRELVLSAREDDSSPDNMSPILPG